MTRHRKLGAALATLIAALGWIVLSIDCPKAILGSLVDGDSLIEAVYLYLRYFTILTNIGIAVLMTVTVARIRRGRSLPPSPIYAAALVYIIVVSVTYEALLRAEWSPVGIQFYTDMSLHDIIPALTVLFWFLFAPKAGLRWRDPAWFLIYPTLYFVATLAGGALGEGYPYNFFNAATLGYPTVLRTSVIFLAVFYALGLAAVAVARARPFGEAQGKATP